MNDALMPAATPRVPTARPQAENSSGVADKPPVLEQSEGRSELRLGAQVVLHHRRAGLGIAGCQETGRVEPPVPRTRRASPAICARSWRARKSDRATYRRNGELIALVDIRAGWGLS